MNVSEMGDGEKSVMLARIVWKEHVLSHGALLFYDYQTSEYPMWSTHVHDTLYASANMSLAWRVLNWAVNEGSPICNAAHRFYLFSDMDTKPPTDAQRAWLDKILELAIAAGMVTK